MSFFDRVKGRLFGQEREGSTPCPKCGEPMVCEVMLESSSPDGGQKISTQWWRCSDCDARFHGVLVESIYDDMGFHQTGFHADEKPWDAQVAEVRLCPNPFDGSCGCQAHAMYAGRMTYGLQAWHNNVPM